MLFATGIQPKGVLPAPIGSLLGVRAREHFAAGRRASMPRPPALQTEQKSSTESLEGVSLGNKYLKEQHMRIQLH